MLAILPRHPENGFATVGALRRFQAVVHARAQRLFDQHGRIGLQSIAQYVDVGEIGRGDYQRVAHIRSQQLGITFEYPWLPGQQCHRRRPAVAVRVGNGCHLGAIQHLDVFDVLASHAAATNDAVADFVGYEGSWGSTGTGCRNERQPHQIRVPVVTAHKAENT